MHFFQSWGVFHGSLASAQRQWTVLCLEDTKVLDSSQRIWLFAVAPGIAAAGPLLLERSISNQLRFALEHIPVGLEADAIWLWALLELGSRSWEGQDPNLCTTSATESGLSSIMQCSGITIRLTVLIGLSDVNLRTSILDVDWNSYPKCGI